MTIYEYMAGNPWVTSLIVVCITIAICSAFEAIVRIRDAGNKTINLITKSAADIGKFFPNRDTNGRLYPPKDPEPNPEARR